MKAKSNVSLSSPKYHGTCLKAYPSAKVGPISLAKFAIVVPSGMNPGLALPSPSGYTALRIRATEDNLSRHSALVSFPIPQDSAHPASHEPKTSYHLKFTRKDRWNKVRPISYLMWRPKVSLILPVASSKDRFCAAGARSSSKVAPCKFEDTFPKLTFNFNSTSKFFD